MYEHNQISGTNCFSYKYPPDGVNLTAHILPEYFELPFKKVKVTLGSTGRIMEAIKVYPTTDRLPTNLTPSVLSAGVLLFLEQYYSGCDIPKDLKYMVYTRDCDSVLPYEDVKGSFHHLLGEEFPDYPIMLVSPDACVIPVCDLMDNIRYVALGKYDSYHRFIVNGPSHWHDIPSADIYLEWNKKLSHLSL